MMLKKNLRERKQAMAATDKKSFPSEEETLELYLREIAKTKTLSPVEEAEVAVLIKKGDQRALERLVKANLRFVVSVARNYQNQGLPLADLINEGNLGLIRAAKRFDEKKNFKFISYAVWWIRQAILQSLAEQSRIVRIPPNRVGTIHRIGKAQSRLEQKFNRLPNHQEIAKELGLNGEEIEETLRIGNRHMSLDAPVPNSVDSKLMDLFQDENQVSPEDEVVESSLQDAVRQTLDTLTPRERSIIEMYFGIGGETSYTLDEIGHHLNLTRERVRQVKERALRRLKNSVRSKELLACGS
jgi:RNA polymerase primary sigma factor